MKRLELYLLSAVGCRNGPLAERFGFRVAYDSETYWLELAYQCWREMAEVERCVCEL